MYMMCVCICMYHVYRVWVFVCVSCCSYTGKNIAMLKGWVGPGPGVDVLEARKISFPCRGSYPGHSSP